MRFLSGSLFVACLITVSHALSSSPSRTTTRSGSSQQLPLGDILILDHLNINHEKGRHDWLKAFYFDFLGCAVDPRKEENLSKGTKTLWANIGAHQFHLPEGKPDAQVLDGVVTLEFPDLAAVMERHVLVKKQLEGSKFEVGKSGEEVLVVTDPWGSVFHLTTGTEGDVRGKQPGGSSKGLALQDLTVYTPPQCNMEGIARFYEQVLNAPILQADDDGCIVSVGPSQTLSFAPHPDGRAPVHVDLRQEQPSTNENPTFPSNYGPHISMYITDLPESYRKADQLGVAYVNPRFSRQAFTLEEAVDDCMFRCLDIIDPEKPEEGAILQLEHEIRSVIKRDGSKYKSCPFHEIPPGCKTI